MRKRIVPSGDPAGDAPRPASGLDVAALATVLVTSESADHPVEHAFDARGGPGGSQWVAAEPGDQTIILEFDAPQSIRRVILEIEEPEVERTQEIELAASLDGGATYRSLLRQEHNFSPTGNTFERESWRIPDETFTHLRLWIRPDKGGRPALARLTSLSLE